MRLDKYVATLTGLSRKEVKAVLARGRIKVDNAAVRDPARQIDEHAARVTLDAQALMYHAHKHIMLYKPEGVLTATEDRAQQTVIDLLPEGLRLRGLTPVGRLDKDTTGLLLLTTDGQLAHRLISPRHHVEKEYIARVNGVLDADDVRAFEAGMELSDFNAMSARLTIERPDTGRVILREGKYHQVKRMFAARSKPVLELKRVRMGSIALDAKLAPGGFRELTAAEAASLYACAGLEVAQ